MYGDRAVLLPEAELVDIDAAFATYRRDGYARVGRVVAPEYLQRLRERADDLMLGRVVVPGMFFQHDAETGRYEDLAYGAGFVGPSLKYRKIEKLERDDVFRALLDNTLFERIVRAVIPGGIAIYRATMFAKAAGSSSPLPWHQDGGSYWGLDRDPELQIWTALDDAPIEAGCLELVPGSHAPGLATPLGGVIPADVVASREAERRSVLVPAVAGEVVLIHNHLWHRSGRNTSERPRRAFTVCYMSDETRCLRKKRAPRTFERVFMRSG